MATVTAWGMFLSAILIHGLTFLVAEPLPSIDLTAVTIGSMLYIGIVGTGVGYLIYYILIEKLGSVQTNLTAYTVPVVSTILGWVLLNETVSQTTIIGFMSIAVAFFVLKRNVIFKELRKFSIS